MKLVGRRRILLIFFYPLTVIVSVILISIFDDLYSKHVFENSTFGSTNIEISEPLENRKNGFWLKSNIQGAQGFAWKGSKILYSFQFSSDGKGRRVSYQQKQSAKGSVLFIGDSFTFGLGVNDSETIVSHFNRKQKSLLGFNYGYPGISLAEIVTILSKRNLREEVHREPIYVVYSFIDSHYHRLNSIFFNNLPILEVTNDKTIFRWELSNMEKISQYFFSTRLGNRLFSYLKPMALNKTIENRYCLLLKQVNDFIHLNLPEANLIILNYENSHDSHEDEPAERMKKCANTMGATVVDLKELSLEDYIPGASHPNASGYEKAALALLKAIHHE